MDLVNGLANSIFDVVLTPLELMGTEVSLAVVSALFGVLAMLVFKYISWQKGIKATKDKIKGHMIAIRLYQDDLAVVGTSVGHVMLRNVQYLGLNLVPVVPLLVPFVLLVSQLVVRYGYEPLPEGQPFVIEVALDRAHAADVARLEVVAPDWVGPDELVIVRAPSEGRAFVDVRDAAPGVWEFGFRVGAEGELVTKPVVIGAGTEMPRRAQPERTNDFWSAWLLPAERTIGTGAPFEKIVIAGGYPQRGFLFLPDGEAGLVLGVLVYSLVAGFAVLKPLGVTI